MVTSRFPPPPPRRYSDPSCAVTRKPSNPRWHAGKSAETLRANRVPRAEPRRWAPRGHQARKQRGTRHHPRSARGGAGKRHRQVERLFAQVRKGWARVEGEAASGPAPPRARRTRPRRPRRRRQRVGVEEPHPASPARGRIRRSAPGPAGLTRRCRRCETACSCSRGSSWGRLLDVAGICCLRPATRIMKNSSRAGAQDGEEASPLHQRHLPVGRLVEAALDEGDVRLLAVDELRGCRAPSLRPSAAGLTEDNPSIIQEISRSRMRGRDESVK